MRTVSKHTVTAVCVAADVQDFDYVETILNAYVNLTAAPVPPVVTEAMAKAALFAWAREVNRNNATAMEAMTRAITAALQPAASEVRG